MCGIAGVYLRQGQVDRRGLKKMADALAHRGPDERGDFVDGQVGLAHTRLSIIDLTTGHQPLYSSDKSICLIVNGEIYNYIELRKQLEGMGHTFVTHSDCEPLIYAYQTFGMDFIKHVCGMFALALYDKKQQRLILARDRLGIKPLFISIREEGVYFASEIKALLAALPGKPQVNPAGLAQYLQNNFSSGPVALVRGIERLLPGEIMCIETGNIKMRRHYWSPRDIQPLQTDMPQAMQRFDTLMDEVMQQHMRTDVPFGLFLSGGVDSSTLLALLSRYAQDPVRTYSVGFPGSTVHNELHAAESMARHFSADHHVLELDEKTLLYRLPHTVWAADELMGDYANLPASMLAEYASQELKVVFSGEGGDEVFAGYGRYRPSLFKQLLNQLRNGDKRMGGFRARGLFSGINGDLFSTALREALHESNQPFVDVWRATPAAWTDLQRRQCVDMETWLPDDLLVKADRMLMAWGVEGRVPFLDHRVVEFGFALPDHLKVDRNTGKLFLRRWSEQMLPKDHLQRKKRGFTVPVRDWLKGGLLDSLEAVLPNNRGVREWFQPEGVRHLIEAQRRTGKLSQPLWSIMQFAIWHALFIDGSGAKPAALQDPLALMG